MKYLNEFHKLKIFNKKKVVDLTGDKNAAKEILRRYKKRGFISQVKRDLYVANDLAIATSIASKFEIAGNITPSSYLSYHAALEYYGFAHQVFYDIYVSSREKFSDFNYDGIDYVYCKSSSEVGVLNPPTDSLVRITDLERTMLDCIDRPEFCGGIEELVQCFSSITYVRENRLMEYLVIFDKQILYQKTGFVLGFFRKEMRLSDSFFAFCKSKIGKGTGYLSNKTESDTYFKEWKLCAPENILSYLEQGGLAYV
ncbi:MAG: hypothetical protein LBD59_09165 [Prevotellaceae bacterium]|jgi:predicted transcriptional regulator of viral defense system|nr:hypothetical protein [Prevotellaceae bacterium]